MTKESHVTVIPKKELFYNEDFGIYVVDVIKTYHASEDLDSVITIKGNMPKLIIGKEYSAVFKEEDDKRFGKQYVISRIYFEKIELDEEGKRTFLETLFTQNQVESMYETLEDPYEALVNKDYEKLVTIKGVGFKNAALWSQRVQENVFLAQIYTDLAEYDLSYTMAKKIIDHYKSAELVIQKIKDNPYSLCEVSGIGWKKADAIALRGGIDPFCEQRVGAFILYYLKTRGEDGSSYINSQELMDGIIENIGEEVSDYTIATAIHDMEDKLWYSDDKNYIGLKRFYNLEEKIAKELIRIRDADPYINIPPDWKDIIKHKEKVQGWDYTNEQLAGIETALKENIVLIHGYAGVGKSSLVDALLAVLSNYEIEICAFSGKAAARVGELAHRDGKTIHRLLGYPNGTGKNMFLYHDENPLSADIIVVDEVSMIGGSLFYYLLRAVKSGAKIILLGDRGQLEAIGECKVASDIIDSGEIPTVWLQKIHRQAQKSAIITESIAIRTGNQIIPKDFVGVETRGELQDLILDCYSDKSNTYYKGMQYFAEYMAKNKYGIMDIQLLTPVKKNGDASVWIFNQALQEVYNPESPDKKQILIHVSKDKDYFLREGDKVINTQNCYKVINIDDMSITSIFNGNMGIVEEIGEDEDGSFATINFEGIGRIQLSGKELKAIELGYAITVHKYQGSQAKVVIVAIDFNSYILLSRELLYTAITRASEKCVLIAQNSALRFAVTQEKTSQKLTHLCNLLKSLSNPELIF